MYGMASAALPLDRLRRFLRELPAGARALLIDELERAVLRGDAIPGGDMLLREVRTAARRSGLAAPRVNTPSRLFFTAVEPFLVDAPRKSTFRLTRIALGPIWTWIARDLVPAECQAYGQAVTGMLTAAGATEPAQQAAERFQSLVAERIRATLDNARANEHALNKLAAQVATPNAIEDLHDLHMLLASRDVLALIAARLPGHIRNFDAVARHHVRAVLESPLYARDGLLPYALVLVDARLATPWQLVRLAVDAAETDDAVRIAASPYAAAVTIALGDIERLVDELKLDLKRGVAVAVATQLKGIHDGVRTVRTELDLSADTPWARRLAAIRAEVSAALKAVIETIPSRLRRLLRPRPRHDDTTRGTALDADEVSETEMLVELLSICRNYAGELAIREVTLRTFQEVQDYLDATTRTLLDGLRLGGDEDRALRKAQVDAAIRCCGKAFGKDYAILLMRAAENAEVGERKIATKA
ncbi:MAG: hypothetical protein IT536_01750 [Hyphomicrobiales bacterium]|nr:hypothetical protein [Hyphomicrobiales bacterium]